MEERYLRDRYLIEMTPEEEKKDILRNILHTKAELTNREFDTSHKELLHYQLG